MPDSSQEWVEFYNTGTSTENLADYHFDDDNDYGSDSGNSAIISLQGILASGASCYWNLPAYLNNNGDNPSLFKNGILSDNYLYTTSIQDKTYARIPDGGVWQLDQLPTKSSISCQSLAPTPSPTPSVTPIPTSVSQTPTPTATPKTPTPIPVSTKSPTPRPKTPSPTPKQTPQESPEGETLGVGTSYITPTPEVKIKSTSKQKLPLLAVVLIASGVVFLLGPFVWPFISKKFYNKTV